MAGYRNGKLLPNGSSQPARYHLQPLVASKGGDFPSKDLLFCQYPTSTYLLPHGCTQQPLLSEVAKPPSVRRERSPDVGRNDRDVEKLENGAHFMSSQLLVHSKPEETNNSSKIFKTTA